MSKAFSITFGDVAENHKGMQMVGKLSDSGFTFDDLHMVAEWFISLGGRCEIIPLHKMLNEEQQAFNNSPAYILIIKNAINIMLENEHSADALFQEQDLLEKDSKALMYGRVVNKHARHNLCFSDEHQEPDYSQGKGTVYAFSENPILQRVREKLEDILGEKGRNLQAEGNYYYDTRKCGIGYHGDAERKKVIAIRLGESIPLCYAWFHRNMKCSNVLTLSNLEHGDMYIMSEKATGYDWRSKTKYTLRHAAGCSKYTKL